MQFSLVEIMLSDGCFASLVVLFCIERVFPKLTRWRAGLVDPRAGSQRGVAPRVEVSDKLPVAIGLTLTVGCPMGLTATGLRHLWQRWLLLCSCLRLVNVGGGVVVVALALAVEPLEPELPGVYEGKRICGPSRIGQLFRSGMVWGARSRMCRLSGICLWRS